MIAARLLEVYAWLAVSVSVHEAGHALAAYMCKVPILEFRIGEELFAIKIGKYSISPLVFGGHVIVAESGLKNGKKAAMYFLAGSFANLLIITLILIFNRYTLKNTVIGINGILIFLSLFPAFTHNDFSEMRRIFDGSV